MSENHLLELAGDIVKRALAAGASDAEPGDAAPGDEDLGAAEPGEVGAAEDEHAGCWGPPHVPVGLGDRVVGDGERVVGVGDGLAVPLDDEDAVVLERVGDGDWVVGAIVVGGAMLCDGRGRCPFG